MAREIHIGDKVRCIKVDSSNELILNQIYTIIDIDSDSFLLNKNMCWYYKYRFELVEECELIEIF